MQYYIIYAVSYIIFILIIWNLTVILNNEDSLISLYIQFIYDLKHVSVECIFECQLSVSSVVGTASNVGTPSCD